MKTTLPLGMLVLMTASVFAQSKPVTCSGIYKTSKDFMEHRPEPVRKIHLNHFLSKNYIEVTDNGKRIRYYKDSIFGYKDCDNKNFRFYKNNEDEYQVLENKGIVIYAIYVPTHTSKGISVPFIPTYYFSKVISSPIVSLTMQNLKLAYADNTRFISMLDAAIADNASLAAYDNKNNMYIINFLFSQSLNQSK